MNRPHLYQAEPDVLGRIFYGTVNRIGLLAVVRRVTGARPVLCYHNVIAPGAQPAGETATHMPLPRFTRQMEWLRRHYTVVPLNELLAAPPGARHRLAAISFDDGYRGTLRHALPVLAALDLPATLFILSDAPDTGAGFWWDDPGVVAAAPERRDRWLRDLAGDAARIRADAGASPVPGDRPPDLLPATWDDLRHAATQPGITIGAHSVTHRALPFVPPADLEYELAESRAVLTRELGAAPELFAYPYGSWNGNTRDAARAAGYTGALTLDDRPARPDDDPWAVPRINIPASIPDAAFAAWLVHVRPRR